MYAYRTTVIVKQGCMKKALELQEASAKQYHLKYARERVYTPSISPNVLVHELNVESEEAHDRFFKEFNATPGAPAFWEQWNALIDRYVGTERWTVTDLG